jgi:hypothetical protein
MAFLAGSENRDREIEDRPPDRPTTDNSPITDAPARSHLASNKHEMI